MITFTGKLNGVCSYNKIKIIVDVPTIITNKINDVKNPYQFTDEGLECYIIPMKYRNYYLFAADAYKHERVTVTVLPKKYSFDGKKGTSLILKSMDIINIE
jgi:hypothetical protein